MRHVDPEILALAALGEPLAADDRDHLAACPDCADEVTSLAAAVVAGRTGAGDELVAPPAAVWDRVRTELGLSPGLEPVVGDAPPTPAPVASEPPPATVLPVRPSRPGRARWLVPAAAGLVVGGVVGGFVVAAVQRPAVEQVVAEATLEPLPGWSASGDAVVEAAADGRRTLVVRLTGAEPEGFREVWLLDREATRLVGLGVLDGDEGRFSIPVGLDLDDFALVDVSAEPFDGDPAHSGDSILRGELGRPA